MPEHITFEGSKIEYSLLRRKRKSVGITVSPEKGVEVVAPTWVTKNQVQEILRQKAPWIIKKFKLVEEIRLHKNSSGLTHGGIVTYLGKNLTLEVVQAAGAKSVTAALGDGKFQIKLPEELAEDRKRQLIQEILKKWFIRNALPVIHERVALYSSRLEVQASKILLKNQKTRWGSCTRDNKININWKIISAPLEILDYLIVHELAHIRVRNHSKSYWELVESILPDYKERRKWLKANGHKLGF